MLAHITLFLSVAILFVPLFKRLGLGAVLGYLAAGVAIGPQGLHLIDDTQEVLHLSEFGVVLLLFVIGLELQPSRLWTLRRMVFGLGAAQLMLTGVIGIAALWWLGYALPVAFLVGFGLAMSSTALVLQLLAERGELQSRHGRAAFAILLFQDLAVIPLLAVVPLLAGEARATGLMEWTTTVKTLGVFALVIFGGRYAMQPLLRMVASAGSPELLTGLALLIVLSTSLAMEAVGLSMSLGAFLAGVLLSESEYRHQLKIEIEPFKGMLLGLFFIAVGMVADLGIVLRDPGMMLGAVAALLAIKALVLFALGRLFGLKTDPALALAAALPQGGEFAFVLFTAALATGVLDEELVATLITLVTLSMVATPLLQKLNDRFSRRREEEAYDQIDAPEAPVIIAGFGPFGQVVARILRLKRIPFTVLDKDSAHVDFVRRFGNQVFYGDAGRLDLLRAAHADSARLFVLTIPDVEASLHVAEVVRKHFPRLTIFAVAVNRQHAMRLMDLGIEHVIRRSFHSSLVMSEEILNALGQDAANSRALVELFRKHDEATLKRQQAVHHDEKLMMQTARDAARELEQLFEQDRAQRLARRADEKQPAIAGDTPAQPDDASRPVAEASRAQLRNTTQTPARASDRASAPADPETREAE